MSTAFTPGMAFAFDTSMRLMRAAGCGEVRMRACSIPASAMSCTNVAEPVTFATASTRFASPPT